MFLDQTVIKLAEIFGTGQSQTLNLVAETVAALALAYPDLSTLRIWETFLTGVIDLVSSVLSYVASFRADSIAQSGAYLRHSWEDIALTPESRTAASFNASSVFRDVPVTVTYESFGWKTNSWINYLSRVCPLLPPILSR